MRIVFALIVAIGMVSPSFCQGVGSYVVGASDKIVFEPLAGDLAIEVVVFLDDSTATQANAYFDKAKKKRAATLTYNAEDDTCTQTDFYENGATKRLLLSTRATATGHYSKVLLEELYYENGKKFKIWKPSSDKPQRIETFHENGKMRSQHTLHPTDGISGVEMFWHDNGAMEKEQFYIKGKLNGDVRTYDREGKLKKIQTFKDGKKLGA